MRHGETDWNKKKLVQGRKDIPLNEYGRHLARETSYGMRQYQIDLAYTSPLRRAKETAEILLEGRNIPLYEDQRIQEISFGSYEGMSCVDKTKEENLAFQKFFQDTGNYIPPEDASYACGRRRGNYLQIYQERSIKKIRRGSVGSSEAIYCASWRDGLEQEKTGTGTKGYSLK